MKTTISATIQRAACTIAAVTLTILMVAACSDPGNQPGVYRNDGYLGMTQTNPNLVTNPTERSHYEDTQIIRRTLMNLDGIKRVRSITNGPHVFVYITPQEGLSKNEQEKLRQAAEKALEYNNPRFDYQVVIQ